MNRTSTILLSCALSIGAAQTISLSDMCLIDQDGSFRRAEQYKTLSCKDWYAVTHRCDLSPTPKPTATPTPSPKPTPEIVGRMWMKPEADLTGTSAWVITRDDYLTINTSTDDCDPAYNWMRACWKLDPCGRER